MPARTIGRLSTARSLTVGSLIFAAISFAAPTFAAPADEGQASGSPVEVENAKNSFPGIVNSGSVYVRSGPAESYYPTLKLDKGSRVTVVGMKLDWLKIVPPEGSFCYISKAFVERSGDGSVGKVTKDSVNVRAGSTLNSLKVVPLCQLSNGMEVKILGEQDEYFKIAPPDGKAFVYINKQFVDPDPNAKPKAIEPSVAPQPPIVAKNDVKTVPNGPESVGDGGPIVTTNPDHKMQEKPEAKPGPDATEPTPTDNQAVSGATTQPSNVAGATTRPADDVATVEAAFEKAEEAYATAEKQELTERPLAELVKQYEALVASQNLTNTLHRIAETRLATLKTQADAAGKLAAAKTAQEDIRT
jgi:uncharacterized protein YgiM (DUF1202 family)